MAFTTEFVMGAGARTEKYIVNWTDSGTNDTVVASFDAGESSFVHVEGGFSLGSTNSNNRPQLVIGGVEYSPTAAEVLSGMAFRVSGQTDVTMRSRISSPSSFGGFITVTASEALPRYAASNSSSEAVDTPEGEWVTIDTHIIDSSGATILYYRPVSPNYASGWESRITLNGQDIFYAAPSSTGAASTNSLGTDALALEVEQGDILSFSIMSSSTSSGQRKLNSWSWSLS